MSPKTDNGSTLEVLLVQRWLMSEGSLEQAVTWRDSDVDRIDSKYKEFPLRTGMQTRTLKTMSVSLRLKCPIILEFSPWNCVMTPQKNHRHCSRYIDDLRGLCATGCYGCIAVLAQMLRYSDRAEQSLMWHVRRRCTLFLFFWISGIYSRSPMSIVHRLSSPP